VTGTTATIQVTNQVGGRALQSSITVSLAPTAPGLYLNTGRGSGTGYFTWASGATTAWANPGDAVVADVTGFGATNPAVADGTTPATPAPVVANVTVTVNGENAAVSGAFLVSPGVYHVNFTLPTDLPPGSLPVVMNAGGVNTQAGVVIPIGGFNGQAPVIASVTNAASKAAGRIAPGMDALVSGSSLASSTQGCVGNVVPVTCNGVTVLVNGNAAPVLSVSATSIGFLVPFGITGSSATIQVANRAMSSVVVTVAVAPTAPGLNSTDGVALFGSSTGGNLWAKPGDTVTASGTGFGVTNPVVADGVVQPTPAPVVAKVTVTVGGENAPVLSASYGGMGNYNVSFTLPSDLPAGNLPVLVNVGGVNTQAGVAIPVGGPAAPAPAITAVVNSVSMAAGPIAPGMSAILFGSMLTTSEQVCTGTTLVPLSCNGVAVLVNGKAAPVFSVSPTDAYFQVPSGLTGTSATIQVTSQLYGPAQQSAVVTVPVAPTAPALQTADGSGSGIGSFAVVGSSTISGSNPAKPGDTVLASGTGFGVTNPVVPDGTYATSSVSVVAAVTATVAGENAHVVSVSYSGKGDYSVQFTLATDLPPGNLPVVMNVGGVNTEAGVVIPVAAPTAPVPAITSVVNGASMAAGPIAPGMFATVLGSNLASSMQNCSANPLPVACNGVSVLVSGTPAPLLMVSASQVNFQVPFEVTGTSATVQVTNQIGGQAWETAPFPVAVAPTAPALLTADSSGQGVGAFLSVSGAAVAASTPAKPGSMVMAYGTGFGATNPAAADGSTPAGAAVVVAKVTATVNGENAPVAIAALASPGVYQVNFTLPADLPGGNLPVAMNVGGVNTQAGVVIPVAGPAITGVSNNASGALTVASGSWVSVYGIDLSSTSRQWQASDFSGNNLPLALDGVSVKIDGKAAAVWYISPVQINVQVPSDSATGAVPVVVTNGAVGTASGTVTLATYAPGFFQGSKYLAAVHTDGVYIAPVGYYGSGTASRPATPGETVLLYGTGFGPTTPAVQAGVIPPAAAPLADLTQLQVSIGGVPATVSWAGIVAAGEYQLNVVIPPLADGDQPIVATIGGASTQNGLLIPVKN
jgi:uncharacterized protein (TIGR03437 family)